jgi:ABC-type phosphate transport system substrate-binding protein|nr:MAG TPA: hypothetical protein [Caudoviricetes sp.]
MRLLRIKSENIILAVCLAFVVIVLIGLILQSCRATSYQLKSERMTQENTTKTEIDDSLALQEFIRRMQSKTFLRMYKFVPIQDSTGQVVGNRLDEVMETGSCSGVEEETRNLVHDVQAADSTSDRSSEEKIEQQIEKEPPNTGWGILKYLLILPIVAIGFWAAKKWFTKFLF